MDINKKKIIELSKKFKTFKGMSYYQLSNNVIEGTEIGITGLSPQLLYKALLFARDVLGHKISIDPPEMGRVSCVNDDIADNVIILLKYTIDARKHGIDNKLFKENFKSMLYRTEHANAILHYIRSVFGINIGPPVSTLLYNVPVGYLETFIILLEQRHNNIFVATSG